LRRRRGGYAPADWVRNPQIAADEPHVCHRRHGGDHRSRAHSSLARPLKYSFEFATTPAKLSVITMVSRLQLFPSFLSLSHVSQVRDSCLDRGVLIVGRGCHRIRQETFRALSHRRLLVCTSLPTIDHSWFLTSLSGLVGCTSGVVLLCKTVNPMALRVHWVRQPIGWIALHC